MIVSKYFQYGQLLKILDFLCPWTKEKNQKDLFYGYYSVCAILHSGKCFTR